MTHHAGGTALEAVRGVRPDLALVNTWLETRAAGWDFLDQLAMDRRLPRLSVIVYATDHHVLEERGEQLLAYGYTVLAAPFDLDALLAAIREMLTRRPRPWQDGEEAAPMERDRDAAMVSGG